MIGSACVSTAQRLTVTNLRCEYLEVPLGIDVLQPRFSWVLESPKRGISQTAYRILVASSEEALESERTDRWDSGKVESDESVNVVYKGSPLESGGTYFWRVRVWDQDSTASPWSAVATFQMGLLEASEWEGMWIAAADGNVSAPLLRKEFSLDDEFVRAYAYICGLGYYELYINGEKIGDHVLDPGTTDYRKRVLYVTYDITDFIQVGDNAVGVMLGDGWFSSKGMVEQSPVPLRLYADRPQLLLQLNFEYTNGTTASVVTDESWKVSGGPITMNSIWDGESYDARLEQPGWKNPGFDDSAWDNASVVNSPGGWFDSQLLPPIRVNKTLKPVALTEPEPGVYVFDFGQNLTGWPRLHVSGPAGTEVILRTAEITRPEMARMKGESDDGMSGTIDPSPNRSAKAQDSYILAGKEGTEVYEPHFTYHGFRYVQLEGFPGKPTLDNLEVRVVHSAVEPVGDFHCSDELINQIHDNTVWGQLSNLFSIPTDCPQRDERLGWMGDAHLSAEEAMYNFDMAAFYTKWLQDIKDAQLENGALPDLTPPHWIVFETGTPAWQVAYPVITWDMYRYYGDTRILEVHYPSVKKWVDYYGGTAKDYIVEWGRGDWVPPKLTEPDDGSLPITSTGYYYHGARIVAWMAEVLGKAEDAQSYSNLAMKIKKAFNTKFLDPETNQYGTGSQTSNAFPLSLGLVPEDREVAVVENLVHNIVAEHDTHLWVGIIGTKALVEVLPARGQEQLMYQLAVQTTYPSWGYMISHGATTLWERWGGYKYFDAGMNSLNHIMFGSVDEFFYGDIAGIRPASPGYQHVAIKPQVVGDLEDAQAKTRTVRGLISSAWVKDGNALTLEVIIPANSRGNVSVPKLDLEEVVVKESGRVVWEGGTYKGGVAGINGAEESESYITFETGSGTYSFRLKGTPAE
ncbi:MAG: family 78 glycoside hydrolase catalytic domain [Fidelibacterota bacterium]|nr:MAG: family 78 glycoside hydrolase catalytic domain [Candidatus Neomarinimicrobiota bacterium]